MDGRRNGIHLLFQDALTQETAHRHLQRTKKFGALMMTTGIRNLASTPPIGIRAVKVFSSDVGVYQTDVILKC